MKRSIILRKQDWGEADELVIFLSRDLGWLRGIAKNAKRSRVRFGGHLEPFSVVDLLLRPRKKDDLVWIEESQVIEGFLKIRSNVIKVAHAAYFLELASTFLPEYTPDPDLFDFLEKFLTKIESSIDKFPILLDEIRLLGILGYAPRFDSCAACGGILKVNEEALFAPKLGGVCHRGCLHPDETSAVALSPATLAVVRKGLQVGQEKLQRLKMSKRSAEELRNALSLFVRYLRGGPINSLLFLESLEK